MDLDYHRPVVLNLPPQICCVGLLCNFTIWFHTLYDISVILWGSNGSRAVIAVGVLSFNLSTVIGTESPWSLCSILHHLCFQSFTFDLSRVACIMAVCVNFALPVKLQRVLRNDASLSIWYFQTRFIVWSAAAICGTYWRTVLWCSQRTTRRGGYANGKWCTGNARETYCTCVQGFLGSSILRIDWIFSFPFKCTPRGVLRGMAVRGLVFFRFSF